MSWIPPNYVRPNVATVNDDPSLTRQEFKDVCDINKMVERFGITGEMQVRHDDPLYADVSTAPDYHAAMNIMLTAKDQFDNLPSKVRNKFDNDPEQFLDFMENANQQQLAEIGMAEPVDQDDIPNLPPAYDPDAPEEPPPE